FALLLGGSRNSRSHPSGLLQFEVVRSFIIAIMPSAAKIAGATNRAIAASFFILASAAIDEAGRQLIGHARSERHGSAWKVCGWPHLPGRFFAQARRDL